MPTFDEVYSTLPGNGWLSESEARLLWKCCECSDGPILEVGCHKGRSTVLLASFGRTVWCVDPFDRFSDSESGESIRNEFLHNIVERCISVVLKRMKIEEAASELPMVGLAYLDGDHTYDGTVNQIRAAIGCSANIIAIHDVNDSGGGLEVKRAALDELGAWDERVERLAVWHRAR